MRKATERWLFLFYKHYFCSRMVTIGNLTVSFGSRDLFQNITLFIGPRERMGLVGKNGAGKSTCFACLAGQQIASAGQIVWRDQNLMQVPVTDRRALGIGRTFQVAQVFENAEPA